MNATEEGGWVAALPVETREGTRAFGEPPHGRSGPPRARLSGTYRGCCACQPKERAVIPTSASTTVGAWLEWFATSKQAACRAYLCTRYHLNALDAEALINTACLQVIRHRTTLEHPLAYFWHTLKHSVCGCAAEEDARKRHQSGVLGL